MALDTVERETGSRPTASVIWLHGLGADANDFLPLVPELDLKGLEPVRFVFPNAPVIPVTINGGYRMRAWYDVLGLELIRKEDEAGLRASMKLVEELIAREKARGIEVARIVLAGFSQGCAMTLLTGTRYPERLAGLIGLSGYLPLSATTEAERHAMSQGLPVFLAHGQFDPVVPLMSAIASRDVLDKLGLAIEWHQYPMQHSTCIEEVRDISNFLKRILSR
jgi:phospholipase/carboxylesterase